MTTSGDSVLTARSSWKFRSVHKSPAPVLDFVPCLGSLIQILETAPRFSLNPPPNSNAPRGGGHVTVPRGQCRPAPRLPGLAGHGHVTPRASASCVGSGALRMCSAASQWPHAGFCRSLLPRIVRLSARSRCPIRESGWRSLASLGSREPGGDRLGS